MGFSSDDIAKFSPNQKVHFLDLLGKKEPLPHAKLALMDSLYQWTSVRNAEIRFSWQMLALASAYEPIYDQVVAFVSEQG